MKKLLLVAIAFVAFAAGYGVVAKAYPSPWPYGRAEYHGYFTNANDTNGTYVLPNVYGGFAFPGWIYSGSNSTFANNFIAFVESQLGGNNQQRSGASFIIQTMLGSSRNRPPSGGEITAWEDLVRQYGAAPGRIGQSVNYCYSLNSYYQGTTGGGGTNDDAFYDGGGCAVAIVFYNTDGTQYVIKHLCANPVGNGTLHPLNSVRNWSMGGRTTVDNANPAPGQTIHFSHYVRDNGPTDTGQDIWYAPYNYNATNGTSSAAWGGQDSGPYNPGEEKQVTAPSDTVTVPLGTPGGTQICQRILYDWANSSGGRNGMGAPVCATVLDVTAGTCTLNINPANPDPTDSYTVTGIMNYPGGLLAAQAVDSTSNFSIHVTGPGVNYVNDNTPTNVTANGSTGVITSVVGLPPTNNAGHYTVTYGVLGPIGAKTCTGGFDIRYTPYYSIIEGDVSAGPGFGTACMAGLSKIIGNNRGAGDGYYGAGSQLGAFALNQVTGFASGINRNTGTGQGTNSLGGAITQPWNLTFSNAGTSPTVWGTSFSRDPTEDPGNANSCVSNYYQDAVDTTPASHNISGGYTLTPSSVDLAAPGHLTDGVYHITGNLQTGGGMGGWLYLGGAGHVSRLTLVVDGDAYINSHIAYNPYSFTASTMSVNSIPQFQLIVKGNIYVDNGVTFLAGFYAAQPSGGSKGIIYTCSENVAGTFKYLTYVSGDSASNAQQDASYYTDCGNQLTVAGSFAAKGVKLNRSHGAWKKTPSVSNDPAELFVYPAELWMGSLNSTSSGTQKFDAVTSLPPIL